MKRAIIVPAILAGTALEELKAWLAITTTRDDEVLSALLRAAIDMCEAFTGQMPLESQCEELLPARPVWQRLVTHPVQAVEGAEGIDSAGQRIFMPPDHYAIELDAGGGACIRVLRADTARRVAVRFTAGLAPDWQGLPEGMRHGILRLAAYHYRQRDLDSMKTAPPAAIAALWQPWRRLRLA